MQIGILLIIFALLATLYSTWNYYAVTRALSLQNSRQQKIYIPQSTTLKSARLGYYIMVILVGLAALYLLHLLLAHQFQVAYVYRYSSKDLPLGYLISAFWAGQEGSFLLWAFLTAIMGMVLIKTAREFEPVAMLVINLVQGFFLLILIKASPFEILPQTPIDGAGLNPLLQNPWMVIHPPVLFVGYAAIAFPFALAVAALIRREYDQFVSHALPWVLFASLTLGAGIIIGGYWAYKVLGWGGYWGWDPVENSSLIPWLTILALGHGLIVQKIKGALPKTNFLLAILSFALVIYATFLTRSGVLADFSVHSFQDLGINAYLIIFIMAVLGIGLGIFLQRRDEISAVPLAISALNRETIILASLFVFAISAFLTFLGTSSPILTGLLGRPAQVDISFYNTVHLPIGVAMALLLGIAPFLRWNTNSNDSLLKSLLPSLILTLLSTAIPAYLGMADPAFILFTAVAAFAFWSNTVIAVRLVKIDWQIIGAPLAHVGVALLLVGIVVTATFEKDQRVLLPKGEPQIAMGYELTYEGVTRVANGKDILNINVSSGNTAYQAGPRFYISEYNNAAMREPDVQANLFYDLYISPLERRQLSEDFRNGISIWMQKGEKKQLGDLEIFFREFDIANHADGGLIRVGARLEITRGTETYSMAPAIVFEQNEKRSENGTFPMKSAEGEKSATVILNALNADEKSVELLFSGIKEPEVPAVTSQDQILVEVSKKPFMSVLWLGTILIVLGTLIALYRRVPKPEKSFNRKEEEHHVRESMPELSN